MPNGMLPSTRGTQANSKRMYTNGEGAAIAIGAPVCLMQAGADSAEMMSSVELPEADNIIAFRGAYIGDEAWADDVRGKVCEEGPCELLATTTAGLAKFAMLEVVAAQDYFTLADGSGPTVAIVLFTVAALAGQNLIDAWIIPMSLESYANLTASS